MSEYMVADLAMAMGAASADEVLGAAISISILDNTHANVVPLDADDDPNVSKVLQLERRLLNAATAQNCTLISPWHDAAARGHTDELRRLLEEEPALLNSTDSMQNTALHWAAGAGHVETCRWLLSEERCDAMAKNFMGDTALHRACWRSAIDCVHTIVDMGRIDLKAENKSGQRAVDLCRDPDLADLLNSLVPVDSVPAHMLVPPDDLHFESSDEDASEDARFAAADDDDDDASNEEGNCSTITFLVADDGSVRTHSTYTSRGPPPPVPSRITKPRGAQVQRADTSNDDDERFADIEEEDEEQEQEEERKEAEEVVEDAADEQDDDELPPLESEY